MANKPPSIKEVKQPARYLVKGYEYTTPLGGCSSTVEVLVFDGTKEKKFRQSSTRHTVSESYANKLRRTIAGRYANLQMTLIRMGAGEQDMSGRQIAYIQNYLNLNQADFAVLLGLSNSRVSDYVNTKDAIKMEKSTKLAILEHLLAESLIPGRANKILKLRSTALEEAKLKLAALTQGSVDIITLMKDDEEENLALMQA